MTTILYGADTAARTRIIALNCLGPGASEWAHFAAAARPIEAAVYSRIWDNAATPNRSNEIVLADHAIAIFDEIYQKVEHLRFDRNNYVTRAQLAASVVECEILKRKQHVVTPYC